MTILESYREVKAGKISKAQFMERARKDNLLKKFISNVSSYNDTVIILKNKGIITESIIDTNTSAPDFNDELVNIILGYVKDPDEANYFAVQGSDYWPDWLDVNMQRDPAYQEYLAKQQSQEENPIDDNEDWVDPAGGMHAGDEEDPAAMYAEDSPEQGSMQKDILTPYLMGKESYRFEDGKNPFNIETNPEDFEEWARGWSDAQDEEMGGEDEIDPEEKHWKGAATYGERNSYMDDEDLLKETFNKGDKVYAIIGSGPSEKIVKGTYVGKRKDIDGKDTHSIKGADGKVTLHPKIKKGDPDVEQKKWLKDLKEGVEIIPAEVRKGVNYELDLYDQPIPNWDACFFSKEEIEKATKKVIKNLEKDSLYYTKLCGTGKKPKAEPDTEVKYKESTVSDTTNKTKADGNLKKELKKDEKSNVKDTLSKTEKAKGKPKGVTVMKDKGVEGKEKVINENERDEAPDPQHKWFPGMAHRSDPFKPKVDLGKSFDKMKGGGGSPEEQFEDLMKKYDWYYEMSDDDRTYNSGETVNQKLKTLAKEIGAEKALELFNRYAPDDRKAKPDFFTENTIDMNKEEYTGDYRDLALRKIARSNTSNFQTWGDRRKPGTEYTENSINQVIAYLKKNPGKSEREILSDIWGFERGRTQPNKKFADLIRRGLQSGKIARAKKINPAGQTKYYYYLPNSRNTDNFGKSDFSMPGDTPAFENKHDLTGKQEQDTPIIWINRDFSPIKGVTVKKGDKGSLVWHEHENQYLVEFNGHRFYAFLDIHFKPFKNEARISLKEKMNKGQLKERIAKKLKEAVMYKIGRGGEGVDYKKTTDRELEDKLKKTGISFTKKNISEDKFPVEDIVDEIYDILSSGQGGNDLENWHKKELILLFKRIPVQQRPQVYREYLTQNRDMEEPLNGELRFMKQLFTKNVS